MAQSGSPFWEFPYPSQRMHTEFGSARLAQKTAHGYIAASDHRKDGYPVGF
jgi:gamma-glutamyltranspeptidase/glutathione hydrolase